MVLLVSVISLHSDLWVGTVHQQKILVVWAAENSLWIFISVIVSFALSCWVGNIFGNNLGGHKNSEPSQDRRKFGNLLVGRAHVEKIGPKFRIPGSSKGGNIRRPFWTTVTLLRLSQGFWNWKGWETFQVVTIFSNYISSKGLQKLMNLAFAAQKNSAFGILPGSGNYLECSIQVGVGQNSVVSGKTVANIQNSR